MDGRTEFRFDPLAVQTPCCVVDEGLLKANLELLASVRERAGCKVLLALKCFSMFSTFPLLATALDGVCASSPHEARLGREEFAPHGGGEIHTFAAGYSEADIRSLCHTSDHLVFNSFAQLARFRPLVAELAGAQGRTIELGIRINPEHSEGAVPVYDPCAPGSRLGVRRAQFDAQHNQVGLDGVTGLHWHNLCEQDADCLERTIAAVEAGFADVLPRMRYVNFGGGHHITRPGYDVDLLVSLIIRFKERWGVEVYLEPGEAVALNAGFLVTTVLDVVQADLPVVIMDSAVPCHMPDVIEMPYRPHVVGSGEAGEKAWTCRIGGPSCLAGDVAGEYSFDAPLETGDRLVFTDMAIYSMVKTNTFNGIQLPGIALFTPQTGEVATLRRFGYQDFRNRLS
ncbi:MAG: carboxynorspermidine decarboxylase [Proteobacteria bacterium]|nr:carboxynorspermidine decarboxylase [Pseudomonadota bacterium]